MSARLLATLCLVFGCVPVSSAQSAASTDAELVVYLRTGGNQPAAPLAQMKRELSSIMHQAGYRVEWRSLDREPRRGCRRPSAGSLGTQRSLRPLRRPFRLGTRRGFRQSGDHHNY